MILLLYEARRAKGMTIDEARSDSRLPGDRQAQGLATGGQTSDTGLALFPWAGPGHRSSEDTRVLVARSIVREPIRLAGARIRVRLEGGKLEVAATGRWSVLDFEKDKPVPLQATSNAEFRVDGGDRTRLAFVSDPTGKVTGVVLNPGPWEIRAARIN